MEITCLAFVIYGLATLRLAILLSEDAGPAKIFQHLRQFLKREAKQNKTLRKSDLHHGIECLRCSSVWVALPVGTFWWWRTAAPGWLTLSGDLFLLWMALSMIAILLNRAMPPK